MKNKKHNPFGQKYTGRLIGGILDTYSRAAAIFGGLSYCYTIVILYFNSPVNDWISFPAYVTVMTLTIIVILTTVYKFAIPSSYGWFNSQVYDHSNPFRSRVDHVDQELVAVRKSLKAIMRKLDIPDD